MRRKSAEQLCLIQWARFSNVIIRMEGSTLFTGKNGTGKSTILDAMTYLLTGNTKFNSAARDRERTVAGYVRGDTHSNGKDRFLRYGEVVSYIAMEFSSEVDGGSFVIGVCLESAGEGECRSAWFLLPNTRLSEVGMARQEGKRLIVYPRNEMTVRGKTLKTKDFMSRERALPQILRALGLRCDITKYRNKLVKMMAFNPENDIDRFIQECVLEPGKIDSLRELRQQKEKFEELKGVYRNLEIARDRLDEVESVTREYENKCRLVNSRQMMMRYQQLQLVRQEREELIADHEALSLRQTELHREKQIAEEMLAAAQRRLSIAKENDAFSEITGSIRAIQEQLAEIERQLTRNREELAKLTNFQKELSALCQLLPDRELLSREEREICALLSTTEGEVQRNRNTALRAREAVSKLRNEYQEEQVHTRDRETALKEELAGTEAIVKELKSQKLAFPRQAVLAKQSLEAGLAERGIKTQVRFFAELVKEVRDPSWRNAIETFLGRKRFYLIVDGEYCGQALLIMQEKKIHGTDLVITDKLPEREEKSGSAAEVLEIPNIYARRYANYLLNGIHLCDTVDELHEHPKGALMRDGMLVKSYAATMMKIRDTLCYLGGDAVRLQLASYEKKKAELMRDQGILLDRIDHIRMVLGQIDVLDLRMEEYAFRAPWEFAEHERRRQEYEEQLDRLKNDPGFAAVLEEIEKAEKEADSCKRRDEETQRNITINEEHIRVNEENTKKKAGEIHLKETEYEEIRLRYLELEREMLEEYNRLRERSGSCIVIKEKTLQRHESDLKEQEHRLEQAQLEYLKAAGESLQKFGVSFIPFFREQKNLISNVRIEEASRQLEEKSKELENSLLGDFVAEIDESIREARAEIEQINAELKKLPFGNDTYRFFMEERKDREIFFRICSKLNQFGGAEIYQSSFPGDEEFHNDVRRFLDEILEEEDEREFTDYRKYFTYDMKIRTRQGDRETESDLSKKQGSASNGEKQTPYFIILAASLMQCYPREACCARLAFIDEAFSALSQERIEQMVKYLEDNHFQVIYAAPPEKIGSIGRHINTTVSLIVTGRYTAAIEGLDEQ